jgi:hypothetical protein
MPRGRVRPPGTWRRLAADIIEHLGLRAFDPQSDTGLFEQGSTAEESFRQWRAWRDRIVEGAE